MTALDAGARADLADGPSDAAPPDWAALLPGGRIGSVTILGRPTEDAVQAQRAGSTAAMGRGADLVIVTDDRPSTVRLATALVNPGGVVRIERSRRRRRGRARRILRRAHLTEISTWWCRPDVTSPRCLVRVDDEVAAATVVRTVADRRRRTTGEALLARTGLARALAGQVSLLAVARPPDAPPVAPPLAGPADGRRIDALVTPGYRRSRAVIGVSTDATGRHLHSVAKVARRPEDDEGIVREAAVLADLDRRTDGVVAAPQGAGVARRAGRAVLVEGAVVGQPLDRAAVRRDPVGALVAGRRWIDALPRGATSVPAEDGRGDALLHAPLAAVAARPGIPTATVRAAEEVLGRIEVAALPVVFEHGDLGHPNLMVHEGALAAVDWERARPDGLPLHDLVFLVAYLTESIERSLKPEQLAQAVLRAMQPHGWARPEVEVHAERLALDRGLLAGLQVAAWTRYLAARPPSVDAQAPPSREEALWTASVAAAVRRTT